MNPVQMQEEIQQRFMALDQAVRHFTDHDGSATDVTNTAEQFYKFLSGQLTPKGILMESQDLNPELAGQAIFKEAVLADAKPINDMAEFAMMIEYWHELKMEQGNRLLEIPEYTTMSFKDDSKPDAEELITLDEANMKIFRIGVMAALFVFKDLPFGASVDVEQTDANQG